MITAELSFTAVAFNRWTMQRGTVEALRLPQIEDPRPAAAYLRGGEPMPMRATWRD